MIVMALMADNANHVSNEPWPSLETASWLFDRASFVLVGSLILGLAATVAIVWMGIVKEHHWDLAREKANEQIGELYKDGERLKKDSEQLRKDTAEANERAAEAKLALEKFKAPRSISNMARLTSLLHVYAGQEYALSVANGSEADQLLCSFDRVLQEAKWTRVGPFGSITVETTCGTAALNTVSAIHVRVSPSASEEINKRAAMLASYLKDDGLEAVPAMDPHNIPSATAIVIMIGIKP